nr:hypothetical protein [Kibdelosporangium sp. MJ126-NF4]CEL13247.1 hypothetical protein [Kibdelosporangium sp. MJ126-NF4]CTQ98939.1 hypothetical protein [Kibdelosporangium sp. MJ126-NF4]
MRTKNKPVLATGLMALAVCLMPAGAASAAPSAEHVMAAESTVDPIGTRDFFPCPVDTITVQERRVEDSFVALEKCWSSTRGAWMYRGNIYNAKVGDVLRVAYVPIADRKFVEHSYRRSPENNDQYGNMPGEWYLAGGVNGSQLQACLSRPNLEDPFYCSWP